MSPPPSSLDPALLAELRAVFVDEVAAQRAVLQGHLVTLERETSDDAAVRAATLEVFRIAHALKGAARAVGDDEVVALAHGVEDALIAVRAGDSVTRDVAARSAAVLLDGLPGTEPIESDEGEVGELQIEPDGTVQVSLSELGRMRDEARELRALLFTAGGDDAEALLARSRALERSRRLSAGLQRLYAQPIEELVDGLERNALEVARMSGKRVRFGVEGGSLRFDRGLLKRVYEALMHVVANAVDHGIEQPAQREAAGKPAYGTVELRVHQKGGRAVFSVADDGAGMDTEALQTMAPGAEYPAFEPGVTTSATASTVSGRGMGLGFVRRSIDELGGGVSLETRAGFGTIVALSVPMPEGGLTAVLVKLESTVYAIPLPAVERIVRIESSRIEAAEDGLKCRLEGGVVLQTIRLERVLRGDAARTRVDSHCFGLVLRGQPRRLLVVERVVRQADIVVRPLGGRLVGLPFISSTFRLPRGSVGLVLDVEAIERHIESGGAKTDALEHDVDAPRVLVVDDSVTTRQLIRLVLEGTGLIVDTAPDGNAAWDRLQETRYAVVVSDLEMPGLDGFELLARCRADDALGNVPFIVLTGRGEAQARTRSLALGAQAFVEKGTFETDDLVHTVKAAMGERS